MAVKLRLRRMGRKKRPFYRIVAADARSPRDGRFIEEIGYYNPLTDPATIEVKEERALYWLGVGAIPTPTVKSLFRKKGIILRWDLMKRGLPEEKIEEEMKKWEVLQLERARRLEAQKAAEAAQKPEPAPEQPAEAATEAEPAPAPAEAAPAAESSGETAEAENKAKVKAEEAAEQTEEEEKKEE